MSKKYLIIGGVVVLAVIVYLWYKNKSAAVVVPPAGSSGNPGTTAVAGSGTPVAQTVVNPITQQASTGWLAANGTVEVPTAIQQWVATMGPENQALFMKNLPNMTGAEISGLLDIVINAWGKGAQPTQQQVAIWNSWYTKYGFPVGGSFSNFTGKPKFNQYGKKK